MSRSDRRTGERFVTILASRATRCPQPAFNGIPSVRPCVGNGRLSDSGGGDFDLRIHPLLSGLGALLIALSPFEAFAQDATTAAAPTPPTATADQTVHAVSVRQRPHPEYDPRGLRFGSFNLNASLDLGVTSTDNLFASPSSTAQDDIIYTATPTVRLSSDWTRHAFAVEAGGSTNKHDQFSNEDADTYYARVSGRFDIGRSTNITGAAHYGHEVTPRTDPDSPLVGSPVEYNRTDGIVGIEHRFSRVRVGADLSSSDYNYDGAQNFRDNTDTTLRGHLVADITPRVGVLFEASVNNRDYDNTPSLNSDAQSYLVGATVNTDLLHGQVAVGQFKRDYDNPAVGTFEGLAVEGNLEWYATELTTVTFDARRDADDQIGLTSGLPFVTSQFGVHVDHELLRNLILSAGAMTGKRDYDSIDRTDDFTAFDAGADYVLNRRVAVRFRYEHQEVDSSGAAAYRDFDANTFTVGLGLRL